MAASVTGETITYQITNLHGDVVATQTHQPGTFSIDTYGEADEYGNPIDTANGRYGWLGTHQRSTDALGGIVLMGARLYNPTVGQFTSPDLIHGGNETAYNYPNDPVNASDLTGLCSTRCYARSYVRYIIGWHYEYGSFRTVLRGSSNWGKAVNWTTGLRTVGLFSVDGVKIRNRWKHYHFKRCVNGYWRYDTYNAEFEYQWKV
jgi:RHS repeat-associated protein